MKGCAMNRHLLNQRISKETINDFKHNIKSFSAFLQNQNESAVIYVLEKLGKLNNGHYKKPLLTLLNHKNPTIRGLAIKNLAKINDTSLLESFFQYAKKDQSTNVRREAVSAIGRLRHDEAIPFLLQFLSDKDPKVVMQAIRGLFVFASHSKVKKHLLELLDHPNELIKEMIDKKLNYHQKQTTSHLKHDECSKHLKNLIVYGDTIKALKHVPDESVHLTFTSPPYYNARDYSIYQSYKEYLSFLESVFKEVHRVTKEGRFFVLNTSPIIIPRISRSHASKRYPIPYDIHPLLIHIGWEFIDDIVWVKPEASVKNRNAGFLQHRKPLAYKPNAVSEMLMVYRKKTDKLIDWNIHQYPADQVKRSQVLGDYETTNIWHIDPKYDKTHSAVFPLELCHRVIKYYSFVGDLIFDPFAGSGTLGKASMSLNRYFFLTEKEVKYVHRIKEDLVKNLNLFTQVHPKVMDIQAFETLMRDS